MRRWSAGSRASSSATTSRSRTRSGVSAGAAVCAAAVLVFDLTLLGEWSVPVGAFVGGLVTTNPYRLADGVRLSVVRPGSD